jgi:hypothetical protein
MPKFKFNFNHGTRYVNGPLVNLGTTRGKGSSTRILYHCKSNSENPSDCINQFVSATPPPSISNNSLFDISSFNGLFDINGSGVRPIIKPPGPEYQSLPSSLIQALNVGANRWGKFLDFTSEMKNLIRSFSNQIGYTGSLSQWKGLYLISCEFMDFSDVDTLATCGPVIIDNTATTMNYGFTLQVKKTLFNNGNLTITQDYLNNIITHELGHALGMPVPYSGLNGESVEELLPNVYQEALNNYETNPPAYGVQYFPRAVETFKNMKGYVIGPSSKNKLMVSANSYIPLTNEPSNMAHLRPNTIYKLKDGGGLDKNSFYRGFFNEIMIPYIDGTKPLYISQISIDILRDIYTSWNDNIIHNYSYKGGNETSKTEYQSGTDLIVFS